MYIQKINSYTFRNTNKTNKKEKLLYMFAAVMLTGKLKKTVKRFQNRLVWVKQIFKVQPIYGFGNWYTANKQRWTFKVRRLFLPHYFIYCPFVALYIFISQLYLCFFLCVAFFRMSPERMDHLLNKVWPLIQKKNVNFHNSTNSINSTFWKTDFYSAFSCIERFSKMANISFWIEKKAVSHILSETCKVFVQVFQPFYMSITFKSKDWEEISKGFDDSCSLLMS